MLGVSDDTVRRWIDAGELTAGLDSVGRKVVDGAEAVRELGLEPGALAVAVVKATQVIVETPAGRA